MAYTLYVYVKFAAPPWLIDSVGAPSPRRNYTLNDSIFMYSYIVIYRICIHIYLARSFHTYVYWAAPLWPVQSVGALSPQQVCVK